MTEENVIKENLRNYKVDSGYLMFNSGTEKRPKWFSVSDTTCLEDIARKFYRLGIEEGKRQATDPYQNADDYNEEIKRWDLK